VTPGPTTLETSKGALQETHDLLLVDLDGVVYLGKQPIEGAAEALAGARSAGARPIFVTNNAARPPDEVAAQLAKLEIPATADAVMTSAVAAAQVLAQRYPAGSPILVVGGAGVRDALRAAGLSPVDQAADKPLAVLQGFAPEVGWPMLAEAAVALRAGAGWVATNADRTLPSPRGPLPGNGSLVAALATATGQRPEVIGKPEPALFAAAIHAGAGRNPLVIGDRLDTDIAGARAAGLPSLLVLSGVSRPLDLLHATPESRPTYLGRDLRAVAVAHPPDDGLAELRDLCAAAWSGRIAPTDYEQKLDKLNLD